MDIVENVFTVKEIDMIALDPSKPSIKTKNKIFPKVSRVYAVSENKKMEFILDINTEIYRISPGDQIDLKIVEVCMNDLNISISENSSSEWSRFFNKNLIDEYEYVMCGTIFHSGIEKNKRFFYASFGGLLLKIFGYFENIPESSIKNDLTILLLIKKRFNGVTSFL